MITRFSYWLAQKIADKAKRDDEDYIRYGIEVTLSTLSKFFVLFLIAIFFNVFKEMFLIILSFALLRIMSGGIHMSTSLKCLTASIIFYFTPAYLFKNIFIEVKIFYITLFALITTLYVIYKFVPASPVNRPIPQAKNILFKWTSFSFIIIWFSLSIYVKFFHSIYEYFFLYTAIGIIIQSFTLTPIGFKFFKALDRLLSLNRKEMEVG